ncbi:hypothetical protein Cantr_07316 [Candida viswanathii]|uniref:Uncharacterized protein n=1 Tax=Candida viswanathii TaxID=5486 RepID=A0A367XYT9_9ASCO|nr:hypothetical protein Cantr_07316 [Candida viswanathii]
MEKLFSQTPSRRCYTIKLPYDEPVKPRISQFSHALYNTLMISLSTFFLLNIWYNKLEYKEVEANLKLKSQELESRIQAIVTRRKKS